MTDEGKVTKKDAHDLHIGVQRKNKNGAIFPYEK